MAQRQEFARLITRGVSNSEACRMVGVNRRTGTRWRYGRTVTSKFGCRTALSTHDHHDGVVVGEVLVRG